MQPVCQAAGVGKWEIAHEWFKVFILDNGCPGGLPESIQGVYRRI